MSVERNVDVLIIGGGLSGLSAAYQLKKKAPKLSTLVVEANDRIGGRSLSLDIKGPNGQKDVLDLGGHWVCERQKEIMDLIHELGGIEYYPQNISGQYFNDRVFQCYSSLRLLLNVLSTKTKLDQNRVIQSIILD